MELQQKSVSTRVVVQLLFFVIVVPFLPLMISRHWDWWEAWVYAPLSIVNFIAGRMLAVRRHPDLIAERARFLQHEDSAPWDTLLAPMVTLGGALLLLTGGIEARFGSLPPFTPAEKIISFVFILAGYALSTYALLENRFFSGTVRLQAERNHTVVSSGPYRWVRHPGYAGALLVLLGTPVFLDSRWAFLPALVSMVLIVIRTALEDSYLQRRLPGYGEYARRVKYRLLPEVW